MRDVPPHTLEVAAAAAAAHDVLVALYPAFAAALDARLANDLLAIPEHPGKDDGINLGRDVARRILSLRSRDGSSAPPVPYVFGDRPGDYQSTPPNFPQQPGFTHWRLVTPFVVPHPERLRLSGPPALKTRRYATAVNEVQSLGATISSTSTPDEIVIGRFWSGPIQNYWNEIAQSAALAEDLSTPDAARLFALLNLTIADSVIVLYQEKYRHSFWRPVTAVRAADTDGNPGTAADASWLPIVINTRADPSYPGAHAVVSAAGASVLDSFFGHDRMELHVTSEVLPGVERSFDGFTSAMREASDSRIFAGVHYRFDERDGEELGARTARIAVKQLFRKR